MLITHKIPDGLLDLLVGALLRGQQRRELAPVAVVVEAVARRRADRRGLVAKSKDDQTRLDREMAFSQAWAQAWPRRTAACTINAARSSSYSTICVDGVLGRLSGGAATMDELS